MPVTNKLRILLADDHKTVREGIRLIIEAQADMEVCGEADNGREAVRFAAELKPHIVLMDISMHGLNGLLATVKLKRILPEIKILTLTRHTDESYLKELMQAGVSGYVLKQSASTDLIGAIRAIVAGGSYLDPALSGKVFDSFAGKRGKLRGETRGTALSGRESKTLRFIALGFSNIEIAGQFGLSVKTIEAHKANALQKLNFSSRKDIVRYAILQGWMQEN